LKQELVDFSSLNDFYIAKLDSSFRDFQCQSSININAKANSAKLIDMLTSQQSTMIPLNNGSSQLIVKYIFLLGSEGAQFAQMITASIKAALTFFNVKFKLIVKLLMHCVWRELKLFQQFHLLNSMAPPPS
jgi:hypothetical protein